MSEVFDTDDFDPCKDDFDWWWDEEGGSLIAKSDDPKQIAQAAWHESWRFYCGN
jgi:hypothetical protein